MPTKAKRKPRTKDALDDVPGMLPRWQSARPSPAEPAPLGVLAQVDQFVALLQSPSSGRGRDGPAPYPDEEHGESWDWPVDACPWTTLANPAQMKAQKVERDARHLRESMPAAYLSAAMGSVGGTLEPAAYHAYLEKFLQDAGN